MLRLISLVCLLHVADVFIVSGQTYPIGQLSATITDAARSNRQVPVEIFYPATSAGTGTPVAGGNGESFPLIVFGHGFSMTYDAYSNFWNEFVPQGYILVLPRTETGPIPFPSHGEFANDLNFIISYFQSENALSLSPFYQKYSGKVAVMGHSMGGGCTFLAGSNAAITTVVGFAPAETNPSAIAAAAGVTAPALVFVGSEDKVAGAADNATPIYNALNSSCKTFINITDASHCGFAESNFLCEFGETSVCLGCSFIPRSQQHATTFQFLNPWLRFFLKGECNQFNVFQNLLTTVSGVTTQQSCSYSLPVATFSASGTTSFCEGGSVDFAASGNYDFLWSTGETTSAITVLSSGNYTLTVSDIYNCKDTSAVTAVDVFASPSPVLFSSGSSQLCEGETSVLYLSDSFSSYLWNNGFTDSMIEVSSTGDYFVRVANASGCEGNSDTLSVLVNPLPASPMIELRNDTIFAVSGTGNFQWYDNDFELSGATESYYVPLNDGSYWVKITDSNGCASFSEAINYSNNTVGIMTPGQSELFYNAAEGIFMLPGKPASIIIFDGFGRKIMETTGNPINLSRQPAGIYFISAGDKLYKAYTF